MVYTLFEQIDNYHKSDPKKYMDIVRSICNGTHDIAIKVDSSSISPDVWQEHFGQLLGKKQHETEDSKAQKSL